MIMRFGKYKDCSIEVIPTHYLEWGIKNFKIGQYLDVIEAFQNELKRRNYNQFNEHRARIELEEKAAENYQSPLIDQNSFKLYSPPWEDQNQEIEIDYRSYFNDEYYKDAY